MKFIMTPCWNNSGLIEHIRIDLDAETEEDKKDLDLLCRLGIAAVPVDSVGKASFAVIYLPAKKEVFIS